LFHSANGANFQNRSFATFDNRVALAQTLHMTDKPPPRKPDAPTLDRRDRALLLPIKVGSKPQREEPPKRRPQRKPQP
jgi:hypothetical protein